MSESKIKSSRALCGRLLKPPLLLLMGLLPVCAAPHASEFSFRTDILPILSKAGCNSGACHGAATGQGGFRLSLLGYDPEEDYWNITREFSGRRVDLDAPAESLFLRKPTRQIEHEGGRRIVRNSATYRKLVDWVQHGATYGSATLKVAAIEVDPPERLLPGTNQQVALKVTARLSDGTQRDVSDLALYTSNDEGIAEVDKAGRVVTRNCGVTSIMIRFSGQVAAFRVAVPYNNPEMKSRPLAARNFIDEEIGAELQRLRIPPSDACGDLEFLRRVRVDLTGRLPSAEEVRGAAHGTRLNRSALVDELLAGDDCADFWTMKLADLLLISGKRGSEEATARYHYWLRRQIAENVPWNQIAEALLTGQGNTVENGPANFYTLATDPRDMAEYAGSIFLGTQIGCARCHAHPTDRWTQDDYYEFAACFAGVSREGGSVTVRAGGELHYPKSKGTAAPRPLGGNCVQGEDARVPMAKVLTNDPLFARAIVNRVWKQLMGRGLVEPENDLRPTNPATHPALLERLASEFRAHHFDLRWLMRTIVSSEAYQLSSRTNPLNRQDDRFYSHALLKPLSAQVLLDAIAQVAGVPDRFEGQPGGKRAVELVGSNVQSYALDVLGRCKRERSCETSGGRAGGLAQALHLINGTTINGKMNGGVLADLQSRTTPEIVDELYVRALGRSAEKEEASFWKASIDGAPNRTEALQDFLWTLLNSREFAFNH